ncbi:MAG: LEA type 2 family protein [Gammaproteobacteria bacterium]|jgi:LEA14-like dessication related protein
MESRLKRYAGYLLQLACVALLSACASMHAYKEAPRVSLASIQPKTLNLFEQRYALQLRILNPNDTAIPIRGLSYSLEINGREFAYGVSQQSVSVPSFGEALLDVDLISNFLNMLQVLQDNSKETHSSLKYRLVGNIALADSLRKLPFDYQGELVYLPADATAP